MMTTPDVGVTGGVEPTVTDFTNPTLTEPLPTEPVRPEGGRGETLVKTLPGYNFRSNDDKIPLVTPVGVLVSQDQAQALLDESAHIPPRGFVYIDEQE